MFEPTQRPPVRAKFLQIRLTEAENDALGIAAAAADMSKSDYVRDLIGQEIREHLDSAPVVDHSGR